MAIATDTEHAWSWLRTVSHDLFLLDSTPLLGYLPPFPWEKLAQELTKNFGIQSISITPQEARWRELSEIRKGLSEPCRALHFIIQGIEEKVTVLFSEKDIALFMKEILHIDQGTFQHTPKEFVESFFQFVQAETVAYINQTAFEKKINIKLTEADAVSDEPSFTQDIRIVFPSGESVIRILLSSSFLFAWQTLAVKAFGSMPPKERLESVQLLLHVEAAKTNLFLRELKDVKAGDFIVFDHIFYEPEKEGPECLITLHNKTLFRCNLKDGTLNILEIPSHSEVYDTMVDKREVEEENNAPSSEHENELVDENGLPNEESNEESTEEMEEEDPFKDEEEEEEEFDFVENGQEVLEKEPAEEKSKKQPAPQKPAAEVKAAPKKMQITTADAIPIGKGELTLQDIPVTVTFELAQIQISAQKLLELQPGNMLELPSKDSQNALITVNGKIVGKGEIIRIGTTLGIRILEIGV